MADQAPCTATLQSYYAMLSLWPHQMTRRRLICWHLALWCCSMLPSAQGKCPSPGRPPWSHQFSSVAMPQTQPTIGQSQLVSQSAGYTPASWYSALSTDTANYRPISVGEPISRLYASIMVQRLVTYTEQQQLRSATQTGYWPELGTIHSAFALQHAVDKHRHAGKPLYLCFVDLKSAYDKVQWQLLWGLLQRLGVHGHMLGAVQSLYDGSLLSMRVNGQCGHSQSPSIALRQAAHSEPPCLVSSSMGCITICRPRLQLLGCRFGT